MLDRPIQSESDLQRAIDRVSFEKSCLDMGWAWEIAPIYNGVAAEVAGWTLRCSFQRPDRETGEIGKGFGRWWVIERGAATASSVMKTMFAAAKMIVEHELMEAFKVDGRRPFDPHRTVQELTATIAEARGVRFGEGDT